MSLGFAGRAAMGDGSTTAPATTAPAGADAKSQQEKLDLAGSMSVQAARLTQAQDWKGALAEFDQINAILPNNPEVDYDRACCQARLGNEKDAIATLAKAVDEGFAQPEHIANDADLASLHDDPQFNAIVDKSRKIPISAMSAREKQIKAQSDFALMGQQMQAGNWTDALATSDELLKLAPKNGDVLYNRACVFARLGKPKDAIDTLSQSIDNGYDEFDHMQVDDDLQSLHADPEFAKLVAKAKLEQNDYTRFPAEAGADIPEVKTVEDFVPGGMRYRIRMSKDATADHPDRLVIWFHPSGGSMDSAVEALSPELVKHHLALVVFPQKGYLNWSPTDVEHLNPTLEAIGKIIGINSNHPLAVGFSAGGQMMLQIYNLKPGDFGGMVLDSAYPIILTDATHAKLDVPPADPAVKTTPILAIVGAADPNGKLWNTAEPVWKSAGVPLTLVVVPAGTHQWLFNTPEREKMLVDWLADVNTGKLPGATPATEPTTEPATDR